MFFHLIKKAQWPATLPNLRKMVSSLFNVFMMQANEVTSNCRKGNMKTGGGSPNLKSLTCLEGLTQDCHYVVPTGESHAGGESAGQYLFFYSFLTLPWSWFLIGLWCQQATNYTSIRHWWLLKWSPGNISQILCFSSVCFCRASWEQLTRSQRRGQSTFHLTALLTPLTTSNKLWGGGRVGTGYSGWSTSW